MARSRRRSPFCGLTTARSEKDEKLACHRKERHRVAVLLVSRPDVELWPLKREFGDPWWMAKDGRLRFDPRESPELARK